MPACIAALSRSHGLGTIVLPPPGTLRPRSVRTLLCALLGGLALIASARTAGAQVTADFNGDGVDDVAVGAPGTDGGRGMVSIFYGQRVTFTTKAAWTLKGVYDGESYGAALATGDFNGDGRPELVVAAPSWSSGRGRIEIIRFLRSSSGSLVPSALSITEKSAGGTSDPGERFGSALASGDFDGDGFSDLAIGIPGESYSTIRNHGAARVLYGSRYGVTSGRVQHLRQGLVVPPDSSDHIEAHDRFGSSLAAGDFDADGVDDLAVGVPYEEYGFNLSPDWNSGAVHVFYGRPRMGGLSFNAQHVVTPPLQVASVAKWFGYSLAVGDFDGDGIEDLAIGAPAIHDSVARYSTLTVRYGHKGAGFRDSWSDSLRTAILQSEVTPRGTALFGAALAAGDFNNDGCDDLAVGVPRHDIGSTLSAGLVTVFDGRRWIGFGGLVDGGFAFGKVQVIHQDSFDMRDTSESGDRFGWSLAALDFNGDGWDDLAVGVPGEDVVSNSVTLRDAGTVAMIAGSRGGLTEAGNRLLTTSLRQANGRFGEALQR